MLTDGILSKTQYIHFMSFHCAVRILCSPELHMSHNNYASDLLQYFVKNFGNLYGQEHVSYNVHNLLHLPQDCKLHGVLDSFSAFQFENYLYQNKKNS